MGDEGSLMYRANFKESKTYLTKIYIVAKFLKPNGHSFQPKIQMLQSR